jgi:CBS domain-containing protein
MVMTPVSKLIYVESGETALVAAQRMIEYEIDCLPVIKKDAGEKDKRELTILGRISKTNITHLFVECGLGRRS